VELAYPVRKKHPIILSSTRGRLFEEDILKIKIKRDLLNSRQFVFLARHNRTLQCMRLTDHVTLNFNNNTSTTGVFFDIEKRLIQHGTLACYINDLN
jgi:hypothetical protein